MLNNKINFKRFSKASDLTWQFLHFIPIIICYTHVILPWHFDMVLSKNMHDLLNIQLLITSQYPECNSVTEKIVHCTIYTKTGTYYLLKIYCLDTWKFQHKDCVAILSQFTQIVMFYHYTQNERPSQEIPSHFMFCFAEKKLTDNGPYVNIIDKSRNKRWILCSFERSVSKRKLPTSCQTCTSD